MSANVYEILALGMRYVFAGLMLLIVLRAWRITSVDRARAHKLRRLSPETGVIGEMLVVDGGERARPGMKYPVTLEGAIGSSRRADIRLRHSSVRGLHAFYQMTEEGLFVRGHASARVRDAAGRATRERILGDGDILGVGGVKLMLVLTEGGNAPDEIRRRVSRHRAGADAADGMPARSGADDSIFYPGGADGCGETGYDRRGADEYDDFDAGGCGADEYDDFDADGYGAGDDASGVRGGARDFDGGFDARNAAPRVRNGGADFGEIPGSRSERARGVPRGEELSRRGRAPRREADFFGDTDDPYDDGGL